MADKLFHDEDRTYHIILDPLFEIQVKTFICKITMPICGLMCLLEVGGPLEGRYFLDPSVEQEGPPFVDPIPDILVLEVFETIEIEIETLDIFGLAIWLHVIQEGECKVIDDKGNIPR
jgi:hypothetical protein